jgi:hypothetical protein
MINYEDHPVVIHKLGEINRFIKSSITEAGKYVGMEFGKGPKLSYESITSGALTVKLSFCKFFCSSAYSASRIYSEEWIQEAFKFVAVTEQNLAGVDMLLLLGEHRKDFTKTMYSWVKRGLWLVLIILYREGWLTLPASLGSSSYRSTSGERNTRTDFAFELYPEITKFLISSRYKLAKSEYWAPVNQKVRERVAQYGSRLFWMCGVTVPEEIILEDVIDVHLHYATNESRLAGEIPTRTIMQYVCHFYGRRVPFTFEEFSLRLDEAMRNRRFISLQSEPGQVVSAMSKIHSEEDLLRYAKFWVKRHYFPDRILHVDFLDSYRPIIHAGLKLWLGCEDAYLKEKNYERKEASGQGISILNIYLFEFLPRWYSLNLVDNPIRYPKLPNQLTTTFMAPAEKIRNTPPSFKTFLLCTYNKPVEDDGYVMLLQLFNFFDWVESKYQHKSGFKGFKNPIHPMDLPATKKRSESKARPFTKWQYSLALNYLASIFQAIKLINDKVLSGELLLTGGVDLSRLARDLGWDGDFYWNGRLFHIATIPAVFLGRWSIPLANGTFKTILYTHYLVHILAAVDSGLRHQSVRWLSIDFDKNTSNVKGSDVAFELHVAVDKVSNTPVKSYISKKTLEALVYHREIRGIVDVESFKNEVYYRGNVDTKKGRFIPLFSSNLLNGHPRTEGAYNEMYVKFLISFNFFLNDHDLNCKFFEVKPPGYGYGENVLIARERVTTNGNLFSPLNYVTDMTPHHTRSSTINAWTRFLTAEDVGKYKTAQKSVATVRYYRKLDDEDRAGLKLQLNRGVNMIWSGESINPSTEDSSFRKSLALNPARAMDDFGCISISATGSELNAEGVQRIAQNYHSGLAHYSTHICTRNGECPEKMKAEGLENRCGFCIYAVKGIDNLEAIEVKISNLIEEIRSLHGYADQLSEKNQHELLKIDSRLEIVVGDLLAWIWCRDHLISVAQKFKSDSSKLYSYRPEILARDFLNFNVDEESATYVLSKLHQDSQFPDLITDVVKARYKALKISLMGGRANVLDLFKSRISDSAVELVSMIRSILNQRGISIEQLGVLWDEQDARGALMFEDFVPILIVDEDK